MQYHSAGLQQALYPFSHPKTEFLPVGINMDQNKSLLQGFMRGAISFITNIFSPRVGLRDKDKNPHDNLHEVFNLNPTIELLKTTYIMQKLHLIGVWVLYGGSFA